MTGRDPVPIGDLVVEWLEWASHRMRVPEWLTRMERSDMAGETTITVVGNLTNEPELRFTAQGHAVASFTVASTPRTFDKSTNEWKDGDPLFLRCSIWRQAAENVAESLHKGARVIVQGRLKQRSYETKEGEKRTVYELDVDEVGPSLKYANAKVVKAERGNPNGQGTPTGYASPQPPANDDPWSVPAGSASDVPPF